jgi:hypothetical protein
MSTHGYIDQYRKNQLKKHEHGFYYDKQNSNRWSKSAQLAAFKRGNATQWCQPTSTTDIHSLKKIRNAKAYLGKYITKNPDVEKIVAEGVADYCKSNNVQYAPADQYEAIRLEAKQKLSVQGNIWYISQTLSKLKGAIEVVGDKLGRELRWFEDTFKDKVIFNSFASIYRIKLHDIFKFKLTNMGDLIKSYVLNLRSIFYPPGELFGSPLGIPLNIFD